METIRAFVAIELDTAVQAALGKLQSHLKRAPLANLGRWVAPGGIHLTLKFLGDVPADQVGEILQAIRAAAIETSPFEITVTGLGCFPSERRPRVIWVGVEDLTSSLPRLQFAVERELGRLGFRPEKRGFTPHLTLARIRDGVSSRECAELGAWIKQQTVGALAGMRVREVSLMRSDLRPTGAIYTCLGTAPLQHREE